MEKAFRCCVEDKNRIVSRWTNNLTCKSAPKIEENKNTHINPNWLKSVCVCARVCVWETMDVTALAKVLSHISYVYKFPRLIYTITINDDDAAQFVRHKMNKWALAWPAWVSWCSLPSSLPSNTITKESPLKREQKPGKNINLNMRIMYYRYKQQRNNIRIQTKAQRFNKTKKVINCLTMYSEGSNGTSDYDMAAAATPFRVCVARSEKVPTKCL